MALQSGLGQRVRVSSASGVAVRPVQRARCTVVKARGENKAGEAASALGTRGKEWLATILSRFGPTTDRATNITTLEFEKPLLELDKRIKEVSAVWDGFRLDRARLCALSCVI